MPQKLELLVIHCTATPEGRVVYPEDIRNWHTWPREENGKLIWKGDKYSGDEFLPPEVRYKRGRGWNQVGYSDMILLSGTLINLVRYDEDDVVDPWEVTNGVAGINGKSRHVVYVGGQDKSLAPKDTRNPAQLKTLAVYVSNVIRNHPDIKIAGHNQFAAKDCPSFNVPAWLRSIGIKEQNIYDPKRPAGAPRATTALVFLLALLLGGCVSFKKCQDKFGSDTTTVVIRDTIPVSITEAIPADSIEGSINQDSLTDLFTGKYILSKVNQTKDMEIHFWKDKYTNALRYKAKVQRDTLIITRRVPVQVIGKCPPVMKQPAPTGLEKLWKQFQFLSTYLVLGAAFILIIKRLI